MNIILIYFLLPAGWLLWASALLVAARLYRRLAHLQRHLEAIAGAPLTESPGVFSTEAQYLRALARRGVERRPGAYPSELEQIATAAAARGREREADVPLEQRPPAGA